MGYNVGRIYKLFRYKEERITTILKDAGEVAAVVIGGGLLLRGTILTKEIYKTTEPIAMKKRIGSTVYEVNCYFNPEAKETAEEKLLRIIKNDLKFNSSCAIMNLPQTEMIASALKGTERSSA
jgi:hypothetical protein